MAKAKKKKPEKVQREFIVGLRPLYNLPKTKRADKAIGLLKKFAFKHFRVSKEDVLISNKLNEFIWHKGRQNVPRKVEIKIVFTEGKANLFLKGEKVSLPKEKQEDKKEEKPVEKKTSEEKKEKEEKEKKKEEKKLAEKAAEKAAMKRGTK